MTSATSIARKHVNDLTLEDLRNLVELEAAESDRLELKRDLPISNDAKGWRETGKLHRSEARAIAKEVVALANSYGGRVYIGIEETTDDPKRAASLAAPLPNAATLSERLGDALNGLISPPLRGLALRAIPLESGSDGYVVIDVPSSLDAPHGFGTPPECYWRRGASSQPMEMRDLQNLFWETRTRTERIRAEQRAAMQRFDDIQHTEAKSIKYRFTLVAAEPLALSQVTQNFRAGAITPQSFSGPAVGIAGYPLWRNDDWQFAAFGAAKSEMKRSIPSIDYTWAVDETGVVEVIGKAWIDPDSGMQDLHIDPYDFCATVAHLLYLSTYVHRFSGQSPDLWVFDGQIASPSEVFAQNPLSQSSFSTVRFSQRGTTLRPVSLSLEDGTEDAFKEIEQRIWAAFGHPVHEKGQHPYARPRRL